MDKIYILLPVHNRREITRKFIECLKLQTYQNYHLVLIDDGSTDGTEEIVQSQIQALTVIKGKGNWWWAGSLQQGYLWMNSQNLPSSDLVLIINDDTEFERDFLEIGLSLIKEHQRTLLLAQCYSKQTKQLIDAGIHIDWSRLKFEPALGQDQINCFSTRGLFLRWGDFRKVGGFYPKILPHYTSDYEFTIRAFRKKMKPIIDPSIKLFLDESTSGYHQINSGNFGSYLKKFFSKKSATNPVYLTFFIALSCPWQWKFLNFLRVWKRAIGQLFYFGWQSSNKLLQ